MTNFSKILLGFLALLMQIVQAVHLDAERSRGSGFSRSTIGSTGAYNSRHTSIWEYALVGGALVIFIIIAICCGACSKKRDDGSSDNSSHHS